MQDLYRREEHMVYTPQDNTAIESKNAGTITLFNDNLVYIQKLERHLQLTREYKFQLVYKRLQLVKDILVTHYSKKSNKSKKHAKKFIKESKKVFDRTRVDDYKKVKSQCKNWSAVQVL